MLVLSFSSVAIYYSKILLTVTLIWCIPTIEANLAAKRLHDDLLSDCKFPYYNLNFY